MLEEESARLLTADQVAARLGVSSRRVRQIPPAELPYLQLEARGRRMYRAGDVAELLERRTVRT